MIQCPPVSLIHSLKGMGNSAYLNIVLMKKFMVYDNIPYFAGFMNACDSLNYVVIHGAVEAGTCQEL